MYRSRRHTAHSRTEHRGFPRTPQAQDKARDKKEARQRAEQRRTKGNSPPFVPPHLRDRHAQITRQERQKKAAAGRLQVRSPDVFKALFVVVVAMQGPAAL